MAKQYRNDSSRMKEILQDGESEKGAKEEQEEERQQRSSKDGPRQPSSSTSSSSTSTTSTSSYPFQNPPAFSSSSSAGTYPTTTPSYPNSPTSSACPNSTTTPFYPNASSSASHTPPSTSFYSSSSTSFYSSSSSSSHTPSSPSHTPSSSSHAPSSSSHAPSSSSPPPSSHPHRDEQRRKAEGKESVAVLREKKENMEEREKQMELEEQEVGALSSCGLADLRRIHQCLNDKAELKVTKRHTVLIHVPAFNEGIGVIAHEGLGRWQSGYVKMPCSKEMSQTGFTQASKWKVIQHSLHALSRKEAATVKDVEETITKYNPKYKGQWSFDALASFAKKLQKHDNYVPQLFPKIAALALKLPEEIKTAIPLLQQGHTAAITLSQHQISILLANAFFCTFPHRNTSSPKAEYHNYPTINFSSLFGNKSDRKNQKLRAIMHYFNVVTKNESQLRGLVTFERRCLTGADIPDWKSCSEKINNLHVTSRGQIEKEGVGLLQVDFAANLVGGGVLGSGLVQEEILFLINPELIVSRLFTERLADSECLIITGSQQFSSYTGYSDTFEWVAPHTEQLKSDEWARLHRQIVAIDALYYRKQSEQYNMTAITRELNKAYSGFKGRVKYEEPDIATGKWGCGAFNGDSQLKAVIQLLVAAKAGRGLAFFTFSDEQLKRGLEQTHHLLVTEGVTVGKLYGLLQDYCSELQRHAGAPVGLFDFIRKALRRGRSQL